MNYALCEALKIIVEEGLEERFDRHRQNHTALVAGFEGLGLQMHVDPEYRLWSLNTVCIPAGVDDGKVRSELLSQFNLEIGGGLGDLKGKVWRVGLMGENSHVQNVLYFLFALETCLRRQGFHCAPGIRGEGCNRMLQCVDLGGESLSPHFSHLLYCIGAMSRPDFVARPASGCPSASSTYSRVRLRGPLSRASRSRRL